MAIRICIVGFGGAGIAHASFLSQMAGAHIVAIYDPDPAARRRFTEATSRALFTNSYDELKQQRCDAWIICSPDEYHAEQINDACRLNLHVLCEKPITTGDMAAARLVADIGRRNKECIIAVQHQMRFVPLFRKARHLIRQKTFGNIFYIEGYYVHDLRQRSMIHHPWRFEQNATPLTYAGCHFVDLFRWLLDDEAVEIYVMGNNIAFPAYPESDCNVAIMRFRSGVIAKLVIAFGAERPQDHSLRILGTEASLENSLLFRGNERFDIIHRPMIGTFRGYSRSSFARALWNARDAAIVMADRSVTALLRLVGQRHPYYGVTAPPLRLYEHNVAVYASLANFISAIQGTAEVECDYMEGCKTIATCCAGLDSLRSGEAKRVAPYLAAL
jgi:predicted dehydrogenase